MIGAFVALLLLLGLSIKLAGDTHRQFIRSADEVAVAENNPSPGVLLDVLQPLDTFPENSFGRYLLHPLFAWFDDSVQAAGLVLDDASSLVLSSSASSVIPLQPLFKQSLLQHQITFLTILMMSLLFPLLMNGFVHSFQKHWLSRTRKATEQIAHVAGVPVSLVQSEQLPALLDSTADRLKEKFATHQTQLESVESEDRLTGLANRQQFQFALSNKLQLLQDGNESLALLFIDLDGFKQVNDTLGHSAGDALLVQVAKRLRTATRRSDIVTNGIIDEESSSGMLARLGGDEFTVILSNVDQLNDAELVAERIIRELELPYSIAMKSVSVSCSIGISMFPQDGHSPEMLLQKADVAMYEAKNAGKGTFRAYLPDMGRTVVRQNYISNELRSAIEKSQLSLNFQPIISMESSRVNYFEALLRWEHPDEGFISPAEFIPIAEETNQILPLGDWVLKEAMRQMGLWYEAGLRKARVSINVSGVQIKNLNLHEWIEQALNQGSLPGEALMLEITESYLMNATEEVIEQLRRVRELGVAVALDDFGTGFSSLNMLAALPIDVLKIDRTFVNQASESDKYRQILASIVKLANELQLTIIAEGVETADELRLLKEMNCDLIQGFLISKPQAPRELHHDMFHRKVHQIATAGAPLYEM